MYIQQPNWLYCLSNEIHSVYATSVLGKKHRALSFVDSEAMIKPQFVDESVRYASEQYLLSIFDQVNEKYSSIDVFRNVTESDLTFMRLNFGFNRMYLVDEPSKSILIKDVAKSVYNEIYGNLYLTVSDVKELHLKFLRRLILCEVT